METNNSTIPVVVLKTEEISKKFDDYKETAAKYDKYALALVIENADKLAVASNNVAQISNAIKKIDDIRKATGEPYFDAVKSINSYAKILSDPLERIKIAINGKITVYKTLQEAQAKIKRDQETAALNLIAEEKRKELAKLTQVQNMIKGMLYGGTYLNMKNESRSSEGCKNTQECDALRRLVVDKFPTPASMKYCNKDAETMFETVIEWIDEHKSTLIVLEHAVNSTTKDKLIASAMVTGNVNATAATEEIVNTAIADISKNTSKAEKKLDKEVAAAKKGIRRTLQFEVMDENLVPVQYKTVDGTKITTFMSEHKEEIMAALASDSNIAFMPGIRFYVHDQNISK